MRLLSGNPRGNFSTWEFVRPFFVLIAAPAMTVSFVSSLNSGSIWLVSYGQAALLAYFLTGLSLILCGLCRWMYRLSGIMATRSRLLSSQQAMTEGLRSAAVDPEMKAADRQKQQSALYVLMNHAVAGRH